MPLSGRLVGDRAKRDVELDVRVFRWWPKVPSRPSIVLDAQQPELNRDDSMVLRSDDDRPLHPISPDRAARDRITLAGR